MRFCVFLILVGLALVAKEKEKPAKVPAAGIKTPGIQIPIAALKADADLTLEGMAGWIVADGKTVFATVRDKGSLARVGTEDNKMLDAWKDLGEVCGGVVSGFGNLWVPDCKKQVISRLDSKTGKVAATVQLGVGAATLSMAATADSVWVLSDTKGTVSRLDPESNNVVSELRLGPSCNTIQFEQDALWVTCPAENRFLRLDPKSNLVDKRIETAIEPVSAAFGEGHFWVLGNKEGKISKIDPKTFKVVATIETGVANGKGSLAFGDGFVWVSLSGFPLTKIDAKTDKVMQQFWGEGAGLVRFATGAVWIANSSKPVLSRFDPKRISATLPD